MTAILVCSAAMTALQLLTSFWWWVMVVPFAHGASFARSGGKAFGTGFAAAGLLWLGASAYFHLAGSRLIAERMAKMFGLGNPWLLVLSAGLVAAVAAGLSGYAGYALGRVVKERAK
jgi:hypothetical protein